MLFLLKTQLWFPTPVSGDPEPSINPALKDLMLYSGFPRYLHACGIHIQILIHIGKIFFNLLKIE